MGGFRGQICQWATSHCPHSSGLNFITWLHLSRCMGNVVQLCGQVEKKTHLMKWSPPQARRKPGPSGRMRCLREWTGGGQCPDPDRRVPHRCKQHPVIEAVRIRIQIVLTPKPLVICIMKLPPIRASWVLLKGGRREESERTGSGRVGVESSHDKVSVD